MIVSHMKRTAIFFTDQQMKSIKALSKKTGLTASELIRRALDQFLQEKSKEINDKKQQLINK